MELPLARNVTTPKLRRLTKDKALVGSSEKSRRCSQVPCMLVLLLLINVWCTFLFIHSFHLCFSSGKIDLYCISMSTGSRAKLARTRATDQPVELLSKSTIIDRLTDGRVAHALEEPSQVQARKQEMVELKVAADQPVELLSSYTIIDRLTDGRAAHGLEEPSQFHARKQEAVELKVAADQPVELLSSSTIIDRMTDGRVHEIEEPSQVRAPKQEPVELKVAAEPPQERKVVEHRQQHKVDYGIQTAKRQMDVLRSWASKTAHATSTPRESCDGRAIFVYELPSKFNKDLLAHCGDLLPWTNLCEYFANDAMGEQVPQLGKGWHRSHQYFLEPIFHSRISNHPCRVYDHNAAKLFYVPFYAGLDVLRWHFTNASAHVKDALGAELVRWLVTQPSWRRNSGADHMFVLGKISWDFRRVNDIDQDAWGSNFLLLDEMRRPYKFLIERHPWELSEVGVPHPTHFHPHDDNDITSWQLRLSSMQRKNLVCFAGARRELVARRIRSAMIEQCTSSGGDCRFLDCKGGACMRPEAVVGLFMESEFCLQPPGDSATRKSVFDSLVAGCIPVLFNPFTAYYQYPWHLPEDHRKYSVFIDEEEVKEGKADVMERLRKIPAEEREEMRSYIVHQIMPGLVYGDSTARFDRFRDAFDIVVDNMIEKVTGSG